MQGYIPSDQEFQEYILDKLCELGTWRLQLPIADMTKEMQKLDPKHNVNLHRKQYGNTEASLKQGVPKPVYIVDGTIIKMKAYDEVKAVYDAGKISKSAFDRYQKAYDASILK